MSHIENTLQTIEAYACSRPSCKKTPKGHCSFCKEALYCGKECQQEDLEIHEKHVCDALVDSVCDFN